MPCQDDELQAWFHDAHVVAAIAKASVGGFGNEVGEREVIDVPCGWKLVRDPAPFQFSWWRGLGVKNVVPGSGGRLPHALLRSNVVGDWEVVEDSFIDTGEATHYVGHAQPHNTRLCGLLVQPQGRWSTAIETVSSDAACVWVCTVEGQEYRVWPDMQGHQSEP